MVRITVVNDNPEFRDLIGDIFQGDRYSTTLIESVESDVLEEICQSKPELLMIGLRQGADALRGWDIVQQLRRTAGCQDLPVVMSSAEPDALNRIERDLHQDGRIVPLTLPFELDELVRSIEALTGRRKVSTCS